MSTINLDPNAINLNPAAPSVQAKELDALIQLWLDDCATRLPAHTTATSYMDAGATVSPRKMK